MVEHSLLIDIVQNSRSLDPNSWMYMLHLTNIVKVAKICSTVNFFRRKPIEELLDRNESFAFDKLDSFRNV